MPEIELGGRQRVNPTARRNVGATAVGSNNELANIAKGVSSLVSTLAKQNVREQVVRDKEDKLDMISKAGQESQDITNAMQGESYDDELNTSVAEWRGQGMSETELRTTIKDYKYAKAIEQFELDKGQEADEAVNAYFDTLTNLELKEIEPLAKADRQRVTGEVANTINSSFNAGTEPLKTRFKDALEVGKKYNLGADQVGALMINTAFRKANRGDETDLEALEDVKYKGIRVIDTVEGAKLYDKLLRDKEQRDINNDVREQQQIVQNQKDTTNDLLTKVYLDDEGVQTKIDVALERGQITAQQAINLTSMNSEMQISNAETFPDKSDSVVYTDLLAKAQMGVLPLDELRANKFNLSYAHFGEIGKLAVRQGGAFGIGNEANDIIEDDIVAFADANSGLDITGQIVNTIEGLNLGKRRKAMLSTSLRTEKQKFVAQNKRLPTTEELDMMKAKALAQTNEALGKFTEGGQIVAPTSTDATSLKQYVNNASNTREAMEKLTDEQLEELAR